MIGGKPDPIEIPIGTQARRCKGESCGATIYFVDFNGKKVPVDCDHEPGRHPKYGLDGVGIRHHINCPDAGSFRKSRK